MAHVALQMGAGAAHPEVAAGTFARADDAGPAGQGFALRLVFGQASYQDQDRGDRPPNAGGYELVEWDEWFRIFDAQRLALVVPKPQAGSLDNSYEIVGLGPKEG